MMLEKSEKNSLNEEQLSSNPHLVVQSNALVNARYKMTLSEQKLFFLLLSKINKSDEDFHTYYITILDLIQIWGGNRTDIYCQAKKISSSLREKKIEIESSAIIKVRGEIRKARKWEEVNLLSYAAYIEVGSLLNLELESDGNEFEIIEDVNDEFAEESMLKLRFDPCLKKHLLQLKENFTQGDIRMFLSANSSYSVRIYWMLKQVELIGYKIFEVEELKLSLGVEHYKRYNDFKRRVLEPVRSDLEANNNDLCFDYEEIKTGRKVTHLKLVIKRNRKNQKELLPTSENNGAEPTETKLIIKDLIRLGFTEKQAYQYTNDNEISFLGDVIRHVKEKHKQGEIEKSPAALAAYFIKSGINPYPAVDEEAKKEQEKINQEKERLLKARIEGNKLYKEYQEERSKITNEIVSRATEEEIQEIKNSLSETELSFMMKNGKVNISSPMFKVNFLRYKKLLSNEEDFIKWALDKHQIKLEKYILSASEEITYRNKLEPEGWEIV